MPYKNNKYKGRKPYVKKSSAVRKIARQEAKKVVNQETETKNFYSRQNDFGVNYNGAVFPLLLNPITGNWLVQGVGKDQYVGDTITPSGLWVDYGITALNATANSFNYHRVMLVQVMGGGTPSPTNVLQSVGNYLTPQSFVDANYAETFRVLYDKKHVTIPNEQPVATNRFYISGKRLRKINFLAATASSTTANNIFIVAYSDSFSTTTNYLRYQARLAFKDA